MRVLGWRGVSWIRGVRGAVYGRTPRMRISRSTAAASVASCPLHLASVGQGRRGIADINDSTIVCLLLVSLGYLNLVPDPRRALDDGIYQLASASTSRRVRSERHRVGAPSSHHSLEWTISGLTWYEYCVDRQLHFSGGKMGHGQQHRPVQELSRWGARRQRKMGG